MKSASTPPRPRDEGTSERMRRQPTKGTTPEIRLTDALVRRGFRVENHVASLPGRPDIVLPARRTAVFVHGCFWHGCPWHFTLPKHNRSWWRTKIEANKARDRRKAARLRRMGWRVLTIWEHVDSEVAADRVRKWSAG